MSRRAGLALAALAVAPWLDGAAALAAPATGSPKGLSEGSGASVAGGSGDAFRAEGSGMEGSGGEGSGAVAPAAGVRLRFTVRRYQGSFTPLPAAGALVRVDLVTPPHTVLATREVTVGADGVGRLDLPAMPGVQAFARVEGDPDTFAPNGVDLGEAAVHDVTLDLYGVTSDPGAVFASRVVTVMEPWEDFVAVSQVWTLAVDQPVRFVPGPENPEDPAAGALKVSLPKGAKGIQVIMPREGATVLDQSVFVRREVLPAGAGGKQPPGLIVRFSLPTKGHSALTVDQPLAMDAEGISVVVPRTTALSKHPYLDVDLQVPMCDASPVEGQVCFAEMTDKADGAMLREGTEVRVARGGRGSRGQTLRVETSGWPGRWAWESWAAGAAGLAAAGAALVVALRERGRGQVSEQRRRAAALAAEERRLLDRAERLARELTAGERTEADLESELAGIRAQLAVVIRKRRADDAGGDPGGTASGNAVAAG